MTLSTDSIFLTTDVEGFRVCRETRTTSTATMTVMYCSAGYIDVFFHGEMLRINKGDLFIRVPDFTQELGPYEMSPDFAFKQVTVDADIYEKLMFDHMRVEPNWWAKQEYVKEHPIFPINEVSLHFFDAYFELLVLLLQDKPSLYRSQILMLVARAATMEMLNYLDKLALVPSNGARNSVNQSDYTFHAFTRLLQQYPHEREVQWYAKKLNITPKYLSEICKERSNKSAGEWIADITISELKHYLRNTTMPIREIARVMEFPNASFFCQYTKKHTGLTPNHFRKQKQA
ncbi:MAG: AraC family transcriptional regulator [Paludibacteraceae bacterium]|nr:AraC family transcriptional regulator [Paludibacteraceae bacterium]MBQ4018168.1 AraC family transcriptional regulator [Paludibacteraceae bacterium]